MPHSGADGTLSTRGVDLRSVGAVLQRVGVALLVTTLPLVVAAALALLAGAPTVATGLGLAADAIQGPLGTGGGVGWVFHVGVLGLLAGGWVTGLGLVLDGLFG